MSTMLNTVERQPGERPSAGVRYLYPGEAGYDAAVTAWNLLGSHAPAVVAMAEHADHAHGPGCGHRPVEHGDHLDYVHDGHRHAAHADHYDEH